MPCYKNVILSIIALIVLSFGSSCPTLDKPSDGSSTTSPKNQYLITENGDLNNLSTDAVDTEYSTFLFLPNESRKIYVGGKLPHVESNQIWIENVYLWGSTKVTGYDFSVTRIGANDYYSGWIKPLGYPFSGTYNISTYVGKEDLTGPTFTSYAGPKAITFKIAQFDARDWNLDVYQQYSYNAFHLVREEVIAAFGYNNMNISFININNANSILPDLVVDYNYNPGNPFPVSSTSELIIYAYSKVYPTLATGDAIIKYGEDHPNSGLLFFVKDYTLTTSFPDPNFAGLTLAGFTSLARKPAVSFVFVKRITDSWNSNWETKALKHTAIHELGHLWCDNITDNATHSLWHNGKDKEKNACVMNTDLKVNENGEPVNNDNNRTKNILNNLRFCEGHLQRGMNVSWKLKRYVPYGQNQTEMTKELFTSNRILQRSVQDNKLNIVLSTTKKDYIKGELIDAFVIIKNNSGDTIKFNYSKFYLITDKSDTVSQEAIKDGSVAVIAPYSELKILMSPLESIAFKDDDNRESADYPWYYWSEGNYKYYLSLTSGGKEYFSNKIPISIKPVPDSLVTAFNNLKRDIRHPAMLSFDTYKFEKYETLFEMYKGSYYEREYYHKLLFNRNYFDAIANKQEANKIRARAYELYKECIHKYPDSFTAYELFMKLLYPFETNKLIIDDIINTLKSKKPNSLLLQVLENQAKSWNKKLECYFN